MRSPDSEILMQDPEFQQRVVEIRNSQTLPNWDAVHKQIQEEFNCNIGVVAIKKVYNQSIATGITVEKKAIKHFNHLVDSLKERFERMLNRSKSMEEAWDATIKELDNHTELDPLQKATAKLKLLDSLEKLHKIFTQQFQIVLDEIDKIKVEQKKMIYDDTTIIAKVNELVPNLLDKYESEGKIAIIDRSILN